MIRTARRRRSQRGFTLIELMTVIVIIAVITVSLAGLSESPGKGTPATLADQISGVLQFTRLRAEARRTMHRVQVSATTISVFENTASGFAAFSATPTFVQQLQIPSGVVVWAAETATRTSATGVTPTQNSGLSPFNIDFKVDGQSTGGTILLTDQMQRSKYRVFVYKTTGTAIARENW